MSLIALVTVPEGIVVAADRRMTVEFYVPKNKGKFGKSSGTWYNDHHDKIYLCENNCVITNNECATLEGCDINHWIHTFMREQVQKDVDITQMPEMLLTYFQSFDEIINTHFMIAGYDSFHQQRIYDISIIDDDIIEYDAIHNRVACYCGENHYINRLMEACLLTDQNGNQQVLQETKLPLELFTLDQAIDFCRFVIDMTKQMLEFVDALQSVGGNTDILVIKENGITWIQKEELV